MPNRAVFIDRDKTLMEDPGYVSDPQAVKLLPGVELAIKSLQQARYKVVVVTNQSGIARGMLTEDALEEIHAELRRQLSEKGVHLDAIYYCPYHPEGTVEQYAKESDLRKPKPGMLLRAAAEMEIDMGDSWMIGDSARDVEAGQRAGCRTIRVRVRSAHAGGGGEDQDENVQADYAVRNLVDAAKIILREGPRRTAAAGRGMAGAPGQVRDTDEASLPAESPVESMGDSRVRQEILRYVRQMVIDRQTEEFSFARLLAYVVQVLVFLPLLMTLWRMLENEIAAATLWGVVALVLQMMALTFFTIRRGQ